MSEQETAAPEVAETPAPVTGTVTDATADTADDTFDATRALEKIRKANAEAKALRDRAKTAEDKVATLEASATETAKLREQLMRAEVALDLGLPAALAKRLQGDTPEAMKADAEALLALVAPKAAAPKPTRPVESLQTGTGTGTPGTPTQLSRSDLRGMSPEAIVAAKAEGRLNDLLGVKN